MVLTWIVELLLRHISSLNLILIIDGDLNQLVSKVIREANSDYNHKVSCQQPAMLIRQHVLLSYPGDAGAAAMWACNNGLFELVLMVMSGDQTLPDKTNANVTHVSSQLLTASC